MSYSAIRPDGTAAYPAIQATADDRMTFIRKVYSLVFLGVTFFAATIALPIIGYRFSVPVLSEIFVLSIKIPFIVALLGLIVSSFLVHSVSMVRGWNLVALFGFAGLWGILSIPLVAFAMLKTGSTAVVFQALGLTCLVFGGLSTYVLITRKDFNFLGGFLAVGTFTVLGAIVLMWLLPMVLPGLASTVTLLDTGLSIVIVLLFSGYVLYDTSKMLHHFSTDMVVPAALGLMVDFIILFRQILFLLMRRR